MGLHRNELFLRLIEFVSMCYVGMNRGEMKREMWDKNELIDAPDGPRVLWEYEK